MRSFIVLCLVAVACADKLGYNYQPVGHSDAGLSFAPGAGGVSGGVSGGDFGSSSDAAPSYAGQDFGSSSNVAPSYGGQESFSNAGPQGDFVASTNDAPSFAPQAEFEKEFFSYTANEEDFNDPAASNQVANSVKQGLRVVFIKGPEHNGLENAAVALAKHAGEQKTDIYVLNKQADIDNLANQLNTLNKNSNNKPEVHFVKYRTPEDAANAQNVIQGQYDSLGGHSQSFNGGVSPVLNFASKAAPAASYHSASSAPAASFQAASSAPAATYSSDASAPAASYNTAASAPAPVSSYIPPAAVVEDSEPSSTYLPASILRLFRL